jgi:UDP-3-O-[3-hydroxymyristoyl] glucosamine N-acyltransferase
MVRQGYLPWLQKGERVGVHVVDADRYFCEHSTPERYLQSNIDLLTAPTLRHSPGPLGGIDPTARIDPTATITQPVAIAAGVVIGAHGRIGPNVVLGEGVVVAPGTTMTRAVAWPGSQVQGDVRDTIISAT